MLRIVPTFAQTCRPGIAVSSTPGVVDASTATAGMFLIISALRSFWKMQQTAQQGNFKVGCDVGNDPEGKVLGIIGLGGIGKGLAKRALGFDMKIQYHNRKPLAASALADFPPGAITYIDNMNDLLATSDVVSLSIPLNDKTKGSFGTAQFAAMKQSACFINTARGAIVDEAALLQALRSGKVSLRIESSRTRLTKSCSSDQQDSTSFPTSLTSILSYSRWTTSSFCRMLERIRSKLSGSSSFRHSDEPFLIFLRSAMELKVLENIESALSTGNLVSIVDEQREKSF